MVAFLAPLLAAGTSLLGGMMQKNAQAEANASQERIAQRNIDLQKEFAQTGIQWRVNDAKAAGIHPLAALGAQTHSFAPVSVGTVVEDGLASGVANMGQDLSRAIDATRDAKSRNSAVLKTMQDLQLQRMGLENELLASQIAKVRQAGRVPSMPGDANRYLIPGQGEMADAALVTDIPMERIASAPEKPQQEGAAVADLGFTRTATGYAPVMSNDAKQRLEEDWPGMLAWNLRNRLLPTFSSVIGDPPPISPGEGKYWHYNPVYQEWQARDRGKSIGQGYADRRREQRRREAYAKNRKF